ncbi:MAG: alanine dehydrogenase [Marinilabiliaceae bacterium]
MLSQLTPCEEKLVLPHPGKSFSIGIPSEDSAEETRMPLTPQGVEILVAQGHRVLMERGAGLAARFSDESYAAAGAELTDDSGRVFSSDIVLKVAPPTAAQAGLMRKGQVLLCLVSRNVRAADSFAILAEKRVTLIAADAMVGAGDREPSLVRSLGEMEGVMAITTAANILEQPNGGKGVLIGGVTGVPPTEVVILGADSSAVSAARAAVAFGSNVKVFDTSLSKLQSLEWHMPHHVFTSVLHPQALSKALGSADVLICSRHEGCKPPFRIPVDYLALLKHDAVIIDLDVVAGGRTELSRPTSPAEPVFRNRGLFFHCLPDITVLAPHTASIILSDSVAPLITRIAAEGGIEQAARLCATVASSVAMFHGTVTNKALADRTGLEYFDLRLLLV